MYGTAAVNITEKGFKANYGAWFWFWLLLYAHRN
jgi:hypothetical protein